MLEYQSRRENLWFELLFVTQIVVLLPWLFKSRFSFHRTFFCRSSVMYQKIENNSSGKKHNS
jgi:hypothetical protein